MESIPATGAADLVTLENWVDQAVMSFVIDMKYKLRLNNHKGHWKDQHVVALFKKLEHEVAELEDALQDLDVDRLNGKDLLAVVHECADVANFALMIADNAKRQMRATNGQANP